VIYYFSIEWKNLLTVEGLLEFGATRGAIRKNKYPVTAFVCRAPRGLHADWCCNASEDNVFDAPFFELRLRSLVAGKFEPHIIRLAPKQSSRRLKNSVTLLFPLDAA
jgi:hypothetical protein